MPSGRTHDIITAISTPILGFGFYTIIGDIKTTAIFIVAFLFSSLMFNGDLDVKSRPYRRWWILRIIWKPYQKIFEHRSIWTHGIIVGTVVRLVYLSPFVFGLGMLLNLTYPQHLNWTLIIIILVGLEFGNSVHTISDRISSAL
jgi:uncharacterized metal-binding protein